MTALGASCVREYRRIKVWLRGLDLNQRPPAPERSALRIKHDSPRCFMCSGVEENKGVVAGACNAPNALVLPFRYILPVTKARNPAASAKMRNFCREISATPLSASRMTGEWLKSL